MRIVTLGAAALLFVLSGTAGALPIVIDDADFKALTPGPDDSGNGDINTAGATWEAANVGWNTSTAYDDSLWGSMDDDYWVPSFPETVSPMYLRYEFTLGTPTVGQIFDGFQDDDAQMWVNGTLVYNDTDGNAGGIPAFDFLPFLVAGDNLIAIKVHDTFGGGEGFYISGLVDSVPLQAEVPEPGTYALFGTGLAALGFARYRRSRQ